MFFQQEALNQAHPNSEMFRRGAERKRQRLVVEETEERMGRVFLEYVTLMTALPLFRYLGRTLSPSDYDWPEVEQKLWRARGNGDGRRRFWEGRERIGEQ